MGDFQDARLQLLEELGEDDALAELSLGFGGVAVVQEGDPAVLVDEEGHGVGVPVHFLLEDAEARGDQVGGVDLEVVLDLQLAFLLPVLLLQRHRVLLGVAVVPLEQALDLGRLHRGGVQQLQLLLGLEVQEVRQRVRQRRVRERLPELCVLAAEVDESVHGDQVLLAVDDGRLVNLGFFDEQAEQVVRHGETGRVERGGLWGRQERVERLGEQAVDQDLHVGDEAVDEELLDEERAGGVLEEPECGFPGGFEQVAEVLVHGRDAVFLFPAEQQDEEGAECEHHERVVGRGVQLVDANGGDLVDDEVEVGVVEEDALEVVLEVLVHDLLRGVGVHAVRAQLEAVEQRGDRVVFLVVYRVALVEQHVGVAHSRAAAPQTVALVLDAERGLRQVLRVEGPDVRVVELEPLAVLVSDEGVVVAGLRGASVDCHAAEVEVEVAVGLGLLVFVEVLLGVLAHVDLLGELAVAVQLGLRVGFVAEVEALEHEDELVGQLRYRLAFARLHFLLAALAGVLVLTLQDLARHHPLQALDYRGHRLHLDAQREELGLHCGPVVALRADDLLHESAAEGPGDYAFLAVLLQLVLQLVHQVVEELVGVHLLVDVDVRAVDVFEHAAEVARVVVRADCVVEALHHHLKLGHRRVPGTSRCCRSTRTRRSLPR